MAYVGKPALSGFWGTLMRGSFKAGGLVIPGVDKLAVKKQAAPATAPATDVTAPNSFLSSLSNQDLAIGGVALLGLVLVLRR
jgi:hypothetical protein